MIKPLLGYTLLYLVTQNIYTLRAISTIQYQIESTIIETMTGEWRFTEKEIPSGDQETWFYFLISFPF